jgi:hypothetical protein
MRIAKYLLILMLVVWGFGFVESAHAQSGSGNRTDVYFGLPQIRMSSAAVVGKGNSISYKVCAKALDANSTVTIKLVAGEPGERVTTFVTISDAKDTKGTCVWVNVPWTPSVAGFAFVTATLNGNRAVFEGTFNVWNNRIVRPILVSNR